MPVSSTSTWAELEVEYVDTLEYRTQATRASRLSMAQRHAKAIAVMLLHRPDGAVKGSNNVSNTGANERLGREKRDAEEFISSLSGSSTVVADLRSAHA